MGLNREELRSWSRYVRDVVAGLVAKVGEGNVSPVSIDDVDGFLAELKDMTMDIETLRYSKVHTALMEISAPDSGWSPSIALKAEFLLLMWEEQFGPLKDVKTDLWGFGGRLKGLSMLKTSDEADEAGEVEPYAQKDQSLEVYPQPRGKQKKPLWGVKGGQGSGHAFSSGSMGFDVGNWWIEPAAAYRDGIIHGSIHGITADRTFAYAIVMTENEEVDDRSEDTIKYKASQTDPGVFRLMNNVTSRQPVRVLRSWRLRSRWQPKAGLRYDGLYRVAGYSVLLGPKNLLGKDVWQYTFELQREHGQLSMEKAMCHPAADEMDDWNEYQCEIESHKRKEATRQEWDFLPLTSLVAARESVDSGYASRRASEQLTAETIASQIPP